jgi:hypothetical protein
MKFELYDMQLPLLQNDTRLHCASFEALMMEL